MAEKQTIFIAHNWSYNSVSAVSYYLALSLSKQHRVVFLNGKGQRNIYTRVNDNLEVYDWPDKRPVKFKDFIFFIKLLKKYRPQAVLAHFSAVNVCVTGARLFGVKGNYCYYHTLVEQNRLDISGNKPLGLKYKLDIFKKGLLYRLAGNIIAVTNYAKQDITRHFNINPGRIKVIYNGIPDTGYRNNFTELKIGFAGRCDYSKGIDILIDAAGILLEKGINIKLEMAGSGKQRAPLEEHIQQKGWQGAMKFIGSVPYEEIHKFFSTCYMLVVPSRIDNPSLVVVEGFSTQTPVIGSDAGAIPELIEHGKTGLLFKTENSADLADKMLLLINDKGLRNQVAEAGRRYYEANFTIDKNVQNVQEFLLHHRGGNAI